MASDTTTSLVSSAAIEAFRGERAHASPAWPRGRKLVKEARACEIIGGDLTPIHRSTLWRGIKAGIYSKPIKVGAGTNRWDEDELRADIERAASDRAAAA